MRIAGLVSTWRDGRLLEDAVRSLHPAVDVVLVLDGGYLDFVGAEERWTPTRDLLAAQRGGAILYPVKWSSHPTRRAGPEEVGLDPPEDVLAGEPAKRNALLELAERHVGDEGWALFLDADEVLLQGELLRAELEVWPGSSYPLLRAEPDRRVWQVRSHALRLGCRFADDCSWLLASGEDVSSVEHPGRGQNVPFGLPYVLHRWHLRESWRQERRLAWERRLADADAAGARRLGAL